MTTHALDPRELAPYTLCGLPVTATIDATGDPEQVTCRRCLRAMSPDETEPTNHAPDAAADGQLGLFGGAHE